LDRCREVSYAIGEPRHHPVIGPMAMPLTPDLGNEMYGRSGFYFHGDSAQHPGAGREGDQQESHAGCVLRSDESFTFAAAELRLVLKRLHDLGEASFPCLVQVGPLLAADLDVPPLQLIENRQDAGAT
jgi:hypothetical protein